MTVTPQAPPKTRRVVFPFTAIVGQEEMKLSLMLNVIDPKIGGVMIMGDRGTGKSTTIRALADLLPEIDVVANDPFNSDPNDPDLMSDEVRQKVDEAIPLTIAKKKVTMVDLPLGATEDRVCGTIDIEKALSEGVKAFEPGLLAKANRGILYVDEVNLLDDHLVDVLLDSAASGWNTVEREGISIVTRPGLFWWDRATQKKENCAHNCSIASECTRRFTPSKNHLYGSKSWNSVRNLMAIRSRF